ncbi:Tyrosinase central domain-containing protein [Mycena sanguinolenta]|uniref:Tyrosinase central domain-containing protein n=1 Tax=Mycena sanguinolenta TaxID=230812 RepID=A0A8H7DKC8_9AGAR|nr:Tyrosinase central domain-containing protein [Mycena sanguinolenta]
MDDSDAPFFPPELEREIFETAAVLYPQTIGSLLYVSKRVHDWIERILYRTITPYGARSTCSTRVLLDAIQSNLKPESFFRDRVLHLHLNAFSNSALPDVPKLLSMCPEVRDLRITIDAHQIQLDQILPGLAALRLRRLGAFLKLVLPSSIPGPVLAAVTHLNIFDSFPTHDQLTNWLVLFPVLTHVAVRHNSVPLARNVLAVCKNLQVLVFLHLGRSMGGKRENIPSAEDDRFVRMLTHFGWSEEDWITGSNGGMDFWTSAEIFIAKKRRGEIVPDSRCWIEKKDGIGYEYFADNPPSEFSPVIPSP